MTMLIGGYPKSRHPLYGTWRDMIRRCHFDTKAAHNYKDKGIVVCQEWRDSFEQFVQDMGPKPTPKHSIDRIDVDGNYEPSNVRWATDSQQAHNTGTRRNTQFYNGIIYLSFDKRWKVRISVNKKNYNVGTYRELDEALSARLGAEALLWDEGVDPEMFVNKRRFLYNR